MPFPFAPRRVFARLAATMGASAVLAIALAAPAAASLPDAHYPTQSLGDRGTNVYAIQLLLRERGLPAPLTGIFDALTVEAVKAAETSFGLPADGVVDSRLWPMVRLRRSARPGCARVTDRRASS